MPCGINESSALLRGRQRAITTPRFTDHIPQAHSHSKQPLSFNAVCNHRSHDRLKNLRPPLRLNRNCQAVPRLRPIATKCTNITCGRICIPFASCSRQTNSMPNHVGIGYLHRHSLHAGQRCVRACHPEMCGQPVISSRTAAVMPSTLPTATAVMRMAVSRRRHRTISV